MSSIIPSGVRVFVYGEPIDMRAGFRKLHALVSEKMSGDLFTGHLFLFLGNNPRRVKILRFDGSGIILIVKLLNRGQFMRIEDLCESREISVEELERLLDGVNLRVAFAAAKARRENIAYA